MLFLTKIFCSVFKTNRFDTFSFLRFETSRQQTYHIDISNLEGEKSEFGYLKEQNGLGLSTRRSQLRLEARQNAACCIAASRHGYARQGHRVSVLISARPASMPGNHQTRAAGTLRSLIKFQHRVCHLPRREVAPCTRRHFRCIIHIRWRTMAASRAERHAACDFRYRHSPFWIIRRYGRSREPSDVASEHVSTTTLLG